MLYSAVSLWQPWASLLFTTPPTKEHETRSWPAPASRIGKPTMIHAAKQPIRLDHLSDALHDLCGDVFGGDYRLTLPRGCFIGMAILADSRPTCGDDRLLPDEDYITGDWSPGRFAWRMDERRRLIMPIPARGQQGFWMAHLDLGPGSFVDEVA